jgi:hypothetical protein
MDENQNAEEAAESRADDLKAAASASVGPIVIARTCGNCGTQPSSLRILLLAATSIAGSPVRRHPASARIAAKPNRSDRIIRRRVGTWMHRQSRPRLIEEARFPVKAFAVSDSKN